MIISAEPSLQLYFFNEKQGKKEMFSRLEKWFEEIICCSSMKIMVPIPSTHWGEDSYPKQSG